MRGMILKHYSKEYHENVCALCNFLVIEVRSVNNSEDLDLALKRLKRIPLTGTIYDKLNAHSEVHEIVVSTGDRVASLYDGEDDTDGATRKYARLLEASLYRLQFNHKHYYH